MCLPRLRGKHGKRRSGNIPSLPLLRPYEMPHYNQVLLAFRLCWQRSKEDAGHSGFLFDNVIFPLILRDVYADKNRQEAIIKGSDVDWTIVRPSVLNNKPGVKRSDL